MVKFPISIDWNRCAVPAPSRLKTGHRKRVEAPERVVQGGAQTDPNQNTRTKGLQ